MACVEAVWGCLGSGALTLSCPRCPRPCPGPGCGVWSTCQWPCRPWTQARVKSRGRGRAGHQGRWRGWPWSLRAVDPTHPCTRGIRGAVCTPLRRTQPAATRPLQTAVWAVGMSGAALLLAPPLALPLLRLLVAPTPGVPQARGPAPPQVPLYPPGAPQAQVPAPPQVPLRPQHPVPCGCPLRGWPLTPAPPPTVGAGSLCEGPCSLGVRRVTGARGKYWRPCPLPLPCPYPWRLACSPKGPLVEARGPLGLALMMTAHPVAAPLPRVGCQWWVTALMGLPTEPHPRCCRHRHRHALQR